jgi:hypothetical protein
MEIFPGEIRMKERINKLARGIVELDKPVLKLSDESFSGTVEAGELARFELLLYSENGILLKGLIFTDDPYVTVQKDAFGGVRSRTRCIVDARKMKDGDKIEGQLHIVSNGDFKLGQTELAIAGDAEYELSFEISSPYEKSVTYSINSISGAIDLSKDTKTVKDVFTCNSKDSKDILFTFPAGEYYIDNVRVVENALIKNGSFSAGFSGYEVYVDSSASAEYIVDSITEDEAADFTIKKTGENDWNIQLKANDVPLVQGKSYHLRFEAKSDMEREIRAIMQGGEDKDWAVYSGENIVKLTNEYQTFETDFTMQAPSDEHAFLSICLGAVSGTVITDQHRVCIDNISLEEID